jgi:hypothetical protein
MKAVSRRLSDRQYGIGLIRDGVCDVGDDVALRIAPGDTPVCHTTWSISLSKSKRG